MKIWVWDGFGMIFGLLDANHAESYVKFVKKSFLEPKRDNFDEESEFGHAQWLSRSPGPVQWLSRSPGPVQEDQSHPKEYSFRDYVTS